MNLVGTTLKWMLESALIIKQTDRHTQMDATEIITSSANAGGKYSVQQRLNVLKMHCHQY